jgi:1-deoxy-D-xylulose-5-phosphate synthase
MTHKILEKINSPRDIKKLNVAEMNILARETRKFLIETVSKTGGHLASNLGAVELTIAIHHVFDLPRDKLVWDVGHESYAHKIFTGRREKFSTLRQLGGLSGFPKSSESEYDAFNTGHSSTSISACLGMAEAMKLTGCNARAIAVIGDGAMTGGMAFEALNCAGASKIPIIIILNDNGMSISKNVGAIASHLTSIRNNAAYFKIKDNIKTALGSFPLGERASSLISKIKGDIKHMLIPDRIFEDFGVRYLGPVDGHDISELINIFSRAKSLREPVLVHVHTIKGKGYSFAETSPDIFHGVGRFESETGKIFSPAKNLPAQDGMASGYFGFSVSSCGKTYSEIFGDKICEMAQTNKKIVAVTAAMPGGVGLMNFAKKFPRRFFDVGIAEQHAVTFSAGLAKMGFAPVFAVYSSFLQRAYDQILHDVALQNLHVVFAIDRAGLVGEDGETHQGLFDVAFLSHIPNLKIFAPSTAIELENMLNYAVNFCDGPVFIRYPRGLAHALCRAEIIASPQKFLCENASDDNENQAAENPFAPRIIGENPENADICIISVGSELKIAIETAQILRLRGISAVLVDARAIKPIDEKFYSSLAKKCRVLASIEDGAKIGGFGSFLEGKIGVIVRKFGFPDEPILQGKIPELREKYGLDAKSIAAEITKILA